jgi:hypothetical protein
MNGGRTARIRRYALSMIPSSSSRADKQHSLAGGNVLHALGLSS